MADQLTLENTKNVLGWEPNPITAQANKEAEDLHMRATAPLVQTVMKAASPQATPEERMQAGDIFKSASDARIGDVIQGIVNLNPKQIYLGLTGGADVKERGYDGIGNDYGVVYNQRGEIRGYENPLTGKKLSEEELAQIGPITSKTDVTAERQKVFQAMGATIADVAAARAQSYIPTKKVAAEAGLNGG